MKKKLYWILCSLLKIAAKTYLWRTQVYVIGITGSVGKTSCRMIVTQVLQQVGKDTVFYTSPQNFNSELGLIFSIFQIEHYQPGYKNLLTISAYILRKALFSRKHYDVLIAEYGIDSPGDMDFLLSVMRPHIGVLTKLDRVHSVNFPWGTTEYWQDKMKLLIASSEYVFYNAEDTYIHEKQEYITVPKKDISQGGIQKGVEIYEDRIQQRFLYDSYDISINLIWDENRNYTVLAFDIAKILGISLKVGKYHFEYTLQPWRFSLFTKNENIFIDSSYNASPESMKNTIDNTRTLHKHLYPKHKILYVLGDIREIGEVSSSVHKSLAKLLYESELVCTVGPEMYTYLVWALHWENYQWQIYSSLSSREVWKYIKKYLRENQQEKYIVLFKGSQNTIFIEEALALQLSHRQRKNLPRQSENWQQKKEAFFQSL